MAKLLHSADWHLGKHLKRFDLAAEQHEALERLLDVVDDEQPDVVVVAGDVFDSGERPPLAALREWTWVTQEIVRRRPGGLPLVVIPGNHDHAERIAFNAHLTRASGLYLLNDLARSNEPLRIAGLELFGLPFHKPARVRALAHALRPDEALPAIGDFDYDAAMRWLVGRALEASRGDLPRVAIAHAFVEGAGDEGEAEDPVMVGGAGAVRAGTLDGFDYVALGHLHAPRRLPGRPHVRYAGSLYPYAFDEASDKSVSIVTWDEGAVAGTRPEVRSVPLEVRRKVRTISELPFDEVIRGGVAARASGDPDLDDYLLVSVSDRAPIPHAQARLSEVYPNALFEQRRLDVTPDETLDLPDPSRHGVDEVFLAFYRHVLGAESEPSETELELLREALQRTSDEASA